MKRIWVLTDGRAGNTSQSLGLAMRLAADEEGRRLAEIDEKPVAFSAWAGLPNRLIGVRGIAPETRKELLSEPLPDVAIAAGRRLSPMLAMLKKHHPSMHSVQIMGPGLPLSKFDHVVLPEHDGVTGPNVLTTLGALHRVSPATIHQAAAKARLKMNLKAPVTTILIGGSTSAGEMTVADFESWWEKIAPLRQGSLLVTTSRRTPPLVAAFLKTLIHPPHRLHIAAEGGENPYFAWLGLADRIVATADSVSMISEACMTGKPVHVPAPGTEAKTRHVRFLEAARTAGLIRDVSTGSEDVPKLDETGRIAGQLRLMWQWRAEMAEAHEAAAEPPAAVRLHLVK